jgi:hypothetical protein
VGGFARLRTGGIGWFGWSGWLEQVEVTGKLEEMIEFDCVWNPVVLKSS